MQPKLVAGTLLIGCYRKANKKHFLLVVVIQRPIRSVSAPSSGCLERVAASVAACNGALNVRYAARNLHS